MTVPGVSRVENRLRIESTRTDGPKPRRNLVEDVRQAILAAVESRRETGKMDNGKLIIEN